MKKIYLLLIFGCFSLGVFAQAKQHPLIPQSPTAAALGKYGDIDVSLYTGQINPSVKLFNIKFNDFSFPIDINYASSGLKVHETPSSVGMGWSMSGTGVINRQIRSVPDEQNHGFNGLLATASVVKSINDGTYTPTSPYASLTENEFKIKVGKTDHDGEPDLFNFSFGGYGGKFIFDETQTANTTKNAVFIPRQAMSMAATFNPNTTGQLFNAANRQGLIEKFVFTDPKGIQYTFNKREGAILDDDDFQYGKNIVSTWYLTKIDTQNGNTLTFNYIQRTIDLPHAQSEYRYLYLTIPNGGDGLDFNPHNTVSQSTTTETVLQEILINNGDWGKVEFTENTADRDDWSFSASGSKPKSLKEVVLKDGDGNIVRKFAFTYAEEITNRLVLRSVTEYGAGGTTANEPYQFEYYTETDIPALPTGGSNVISREDNWGYYNANTTGTLLPDYQTVITTSLGKNDTLTKEQFVKYVDSLKVAAKNIDSTKVKENPTPIPTSLNSNVYYLTATNRNPDFSSALVGQLKKITYPTKGSTEFVYEANSYFSNQSEEFNPCAGTFADVATVTKTIPSQCANNSSSITIASGAFSCMKVNYNLTIFSQGQDIVDGEVSILNSDGTVIFSETLRGINSQNPPPKIGSRFVVLAPGTYTLLADLCGENANGSNASSATITLQGIAVTPANYVTRTSGGLRIKEVKDCPNNTSPCMTKEYSYTNLDDSTNSSGRIVTNGKYYHPIAYFTTTDVLTSALFLNSASQLPLSTTLGHYVGYKTVIMKEVALNDLNEKVYKGKTVFEYKSPDENDAPDLNSMTFPYTSVSYDWQRGVVTQSKVFDQAGDWLKDNQSVYVQKSSLEYFKFLGLKAGKVIHNIEASPLGYTDDIYNYNKYISLSGFQFNQQSIQTEQFKVGTTLSSIESTTDYVYANNIHLQPTQTSTLSSKGESLVMQYQYPHDITTGDLASSALALRNARRKTEVLQTETFRDGVSINKTQNFFDVFDSNILPSKQRTFIDGSATVATESQQLSYDSYGNLTSYKEVNGGDGIINSLMWGYKGQYPVVSIINGVPANLSVLLNETSASVITTTANALRTTLPNAHISHYDYQPMIGLKAQTNAAQLKTCFTYDGLNRLSKVLDNLGFILKAHDYQIATTIGGDNYVKEIMPRTGSATLLTGYQNVQSSFSYLDGLGRPLQVAAQQAGGDGTNDIVTNATTYDGYGRVSKSYIPFPNAGSGALSPLPASLDGDTRPYSENIMFDNSPLNRLFQVLGVGMAWATANKITQSYTEISGGIRSYTVASDGSVSSGTYPANSLYKKTLTNEQGNKTIEYTDKEGRIVQKEQELNATETAKTVYIFRNNGQLAFVVQPHVYASATSFTLSSSVFLEGCFGYIYDSRGRLIERHTPGAGWRYSIFDKRDNETIFADESDKAKDFWQFKKFDSFSRVVQTGLINNIGSTSRSQLQTDFDSYAGQSFESRGTDLLGYTNVSFPASYKPEDGNVKFVNYFDDYGFNTNTDYDFKVANAFHPQQTNVKGMITGKLSRNLSTSTWQKMVLYYDYLGRIIEDFHLTNKNNLVRKDNQYRFNGELLKARYIKTNSANALISTKILSYEYDHLSRKTKFKYSLNGNEKTIASYNYDATGRMSQKSYSPSGAVGSNQSGLWTNSTTWQGASVPTISDNVTINSGHTVTIPNGQTVSAGSVFDKGILQNFGTLNLGTLSPSASAGTLQILNYKYHIRGGLKGINLDANNDLTNDLFSYKLTYEDDGTYYDGNIRNQYWKSNIDGIKRAYEFSYDGDSRLTGANYGSEKAGENYALSGITHDFNGNIKTLSRSGATNTNYTAFGNVDNLTYTYQSNSNKLSKIADVNTANADLGDFRDGTNADDDYEYWLDGSLKKDKNKKIASITYNYLKLPEIITFDDTKTITTEYDAAGTKLKKIVSGGETTDYEEDEICVNNVLYQTSHDEGRINAEGEYEYNITDHNNDLRVAFRDSLGFAVPTQSIFYDPWGLTMKGMQITRNPLNFNKYQFLNRETQFETGYIDLIHRQFDPQTGRFTSQDPVIEGQEHLSLYQYGWNNPILRPDPNGQYPEGGEDEVNSEFFLARLVTTAFYDVKHAIFNTAARATGSNLRASYVKNSDGQEVFETSYGKVAPPSSLKEAGKEILSAGLDALIVSGVKMGPAGIGVLAESSETQTARGVKNVSESITTAYKRPSGSVTPQQRASVQGKPCVDCGSTPKKMVADHKKPLVKEYYETGTIDKKKMRSVDAVQPQCPTCSAKQGADMSRYSKEQKKALGL